MKGAVATIGPVTRFTRRGRGPDLTAGTRDGDASSNSAGRTPPAPQQRPTQSDVADFTTTQRLDAPVTPAATAEDQFFEFLFSAQEYNYATLKELAAKREPLPRFPLKNVKITFNIDADYRVMQTRYTRNVVGVVEGSDPKLKDTYVAFGAHYDHVGYAEGPIAEGRLQGAVGRVSPAAAEDRIWNGADDDGSGTVTIMAIARAFALGPKPRRSMLFVWHTGEERGLLGSRYFVDNPIAPLDKIVAQVNLDMVGRNRNDDPREANTIYLVGSDRISTDLHNATIEANEFLNRPLTLDFEMNDPSDVEQFYYRSDHYSYAAKGIPIVFMFTGLHDDYHANTDSADKINYEKMARVGQLGYEIGVRLGNSQTPPVRDNLGPRVGKGSSGKLN
jgi:hypothetical protein